MELIFFGKLCWVFFGGGGNRGCALDDEIVGRVGGLVDRILLS
jgi:hypothetical protein